MAENASILTTRFAPSPTGLLHVGHAYSALIAYHAAKKVGGRFLLRIEDIDQTRCKPEFEDAIYRDLSWLGIEWETPVRRQSGHFADYENALDALRTHGLIYRCFKTRKEVLDEIARAPHLSPDGPEGPQYIGTILSPTEERSLIEEGKPFAWRLSLESAKAFLGERYDALNFNEVSADGVGHTIRATPEIFGDVVIGRKDSGTSYHLASVHDDAMQGITHVIRGDDLQSAAHLHCLLQTLLDYPTPTYQHHRLITDKAGKRLAKRDQSQTIKAVRESGVTRAELLKNLGL